MSETPKRRWGDRRDAVLLRETDALHFIMGIIYPTAPTTRPTSPSVLIWSPSRPTL